MSQYQRTCETGLFGPGAGFPIVGGGARGVSSLPRLWRAQVHLDKPYLATDIWLIRGGLFGGCRPPDPRPYLEGLTSQTPRLGAAAPRIPALFWEAPPNSFPKEGPGRPDAKPRRAPGRLLCRSPALDRELPQRRRKTYRAGLWPRGQENPPCGLVGRLLAPGDRRFLNRLRVVYVWSRTEGL